jgi:hypothetical protein
MNICKSMLFVFIFLIPFGVIMGCSRVSSTIIPDDATYDSLPALSDAGQIGTGSERQMQGTWSATNSKDMRRTYYWGDHIFSMRLSPVIP